jgi:hypothetical protein
MFDISKNEISTVEEKLLYNIQELLKEIVKPKEEKPTIEEKKKRKRLHGKFNTRTRIWN